MRDTTITQCNGAKIEDSLRRGLVARLESGGSAVFAHYFVELADLEDLTELIEVDLELDDDALDGDAWGELSPLIEDWFAAGEDLEGMEDWDSRLAEGWTDGVVMTRSAFGQRPGRDAASTVFRG